MKSPLNISKTAKRYGFDEDITQKNLLIAFDKFIWQDCQIKKIDELISFEKLYQNYNTNFVFCYDTEVNEVSPVYMYNGEMVLLSKGAFQRTVNHKGEKYEKFVEAGLTDLETVVVLTFLAEISGLYRKDSYHFGVPPFVQSVCETLNSAIGKLPAYTDIVVRACNDYDKVDFEVDDIFSPGFCLTCSADYKGWKDKSKNRYKITPLDAEHTKARKLFGIHNISEQQVTFLQDAQFRVTGISNWGEGMKQIEMQEI